MAGQTAAATAAGRNRHCRHRRPPAGHGRARRRPAPRHAHILPELPAPLRFHPVAGFERVLVYYIDSPDAVDILRLWDASRGLEALGEETDP